MRDALGRGEPPVAPVLDAVFLLLAGALLITPGLMSDAVALLLLFPPVRRGAARWLVRRLLGRAQLHVFGSETESNHQPPSSRDRRGDGPIIEGEFERLNEKATGPHRRNDRNQV
jgi:UPF0716 protein FxsA